MYDVLFKHIEDKTGEKLADNERDVIMAAFDRKLLQKERKSSEGLSEEEHNLIMTKLKPQKLRKRQYFLQEGENAMQISPGPIRIIFSVFRKI